MKITVLCFILLFFLIIGVANACDSDNETLKINEHDTGKIEINSNSTILSKTPQNKLTATSSKVKVNIKANDVKMYYKDGSKFKITLKDNSKKVMKNAKVKIEINGQTYNKVTDSKGTASVNLNFKSGSYKVITTYAGSGQYEKASVKNTVTVKSTIKTDDLTKYYKNSKTYSSTFYDKKGKLLKETSVKFKLNGKTYSVKTNKKGIARLSVDLIPGKYQITSSNPKTSESVSKTITIRSVVETHDMTMTAKDKSRFKVKILNSNGIASPNKKVTMTVAGKTYTARTNSSGIASISLDLDVGKYPITTEYNGLKYTNQITVSKAAVKEEVKKTEFTHSVLIPSYVNVTTDYVFHNSGYALKTGFDGIIKMPKQDLFSIKIGDDKEYLFSQSKIANLNTKIIGYQYHLVPFDGSEVKSDFKKDNLNGDGIIISKNGDFTQIDFKSTIDNDLNLFNVCLNQTGTITYSFHNLNININYLTYKFDESGLKYNLAKFYDVNLNNYNDKTYSELIGNNSCNVRYTNTNESVVFNQTGKSIINTLSKEELITKFAINTKEENLRKCLDFNESYSILNCEITEEKIARYLNDTVYDSDVIVQYLKDNNITWKKDNPVSLLIHSGDLYVLNRDLCVKI